MYTRLGSTGVAACALQAAVASKQTHAWFSDEGKVRRKDAESLQLYRIPWTLNITRSSRIREFPKKSPSIAIEQDTLFPDASTYKFTRLPLRRPKNLGEEVAPR